MFEVTVVEKVFGKLVMNTYRLPTVEQMVKFKELCKQDGTIVIAKRVTAAVSA